MPTALTTPTRVADRLRQRAGPGFLTTTWSDENQALFRALSLEKLVTALFIGLITFVAGLNILVVLTMTVTDKARDIAILIAMGARRPQIRNIFMLEGLAVGLAGTLAGLVGGYGFAWVADHWRLIPLEPRGLRDPVRPVSFQRLGRAVDFRRRRWPSALPRRCTLRERRREFCRWTSCDLSRSCWHASMRMSDAEPESGTGAMCRSNRCAGIWYEFTSNAHPD